MNKDYLKAKTVEPFHPNPDGTTTWFNTKQVVKVGAVLLALLLLARWAVALPATELEDQGVRKGLRRSAELTKGHRIRSMLVGGFLVWLAFSLPNGVGAVVLLLTGWPFFVSDVISVVIAAVLIPAASIGLTLLYYDLRARRTQPEPATEPIPV